MASLRRTILDAIATRLGTAPGFTAVVRGAKVQATNVTKLAFVEDTGEGVAGTNRTDWYQKQLRVVVTVRVQAEDAGLLTPYEYLDAALVDLEKVIHDDPANLGVPALQMIEQDGYTVERPDDENVLELEWRLEATYFHEFRDPEAGPTS